MEEKDLAAVVKDAVLRAFHEEVQKKKNQVELGEMYGNIVSGTLSAIGTIAHVAGDNPNEIVRDIVAQTYEQVVNG